MACPLVLAFDPQLLRNVLNKKQSKHGFRCCGVVRGAHVVCLVDKSHPETEAGAGTRVLCTQNTSAVMDKPSPMAAVNLVIFYS